MPGVPPTRSRRFLAAVLPVVTITLTAGLGLLVAPVTAASADICQTCGGGGPPPPPPPPKNLAEFTFAVQQLQADSNGAAAEVDYDDTSESSVSPVILDACGSTAVNGIAGYAWSFSDGTPPISTSDCETTWHRPLSSTYHDLNVTLTILPKSGSSFSVTHAEQYRDLVIASLGDSAASGEGAAENQTSPAFDISENCDRSGWAASSQAALRMQQSMPDTTVHFWHLACSGATLAEGANGDVTEGGLLYPYDGIRRGQTLPAQVTELGTLMSETKLPVSALLITAGANDTGWANVMETCLFQSVIAGVTDPLAFYFVQDSCINGYAGQVASAVAALPSHFALLNAALVQLMIAYPGQLTPWDIYLTQYWDPVDSLSAQPLVCGGEPLAGQDMRNWAVSAILNPLQADVQNAASTFDWNFIGGIQQAFQGHGVCQAASNRWINSVLDSVAEQGDFNGSWHANRTGQLQIASIIYNAISPNLG
jgi:hypothetical protein